jgi:hypothetical protein
MIEMEIDKYKELYNLSLEVLKEEQDRFNRIDEKASKYFAVITFLLGAFGFFGKIIIDKARPPFSNFEWVLIILAFIILLLLAASFFIIFTVLRIQRLKVLPLTLEMLEFFNDNRLIDIYFALSKGNEEAVRENLEVTKYKANMLNIGYILINITVILLLSFSIFYIIYMINPFQGMKILQ